MLDSPLRGLGLNSPFDTQDDYEIAGQLPPLIADFAHNYYRANAAPTDFDSLFTFARTGPAWYLDASGDVQEVADGEVRTDAHYWDGTAWRRGLMIESEARTNLLLNSGTLATQDVSTSAQEYTLHFTGAGTVTLSGTSTAGPLVGTGAGEQNRVSLTFTPTAGTLTLTVSGTVTNAQLEAGDTPSSYIPTTGTTATRNAETLTIAAVNLPYSATVMSIYMRGRMTYAETGTFGSGSGGQGDIVFYLLKADGDNFLEAFLATNNPADLISFTQKATGTRDVANTSFPPDPGYLKPFSIAGRHGATFINGAIFGAAVAANETPTALPGLSAEDLQLFPVGNGFITEFRMWDTDIGDVGIEQVTA